MSIYSDDVKLPNGVIINDYCLVDNLSWVNVLAVTTDREIILERQYRYGIGCFDYELCSGFIENEETPIEAAKRELLEETGYSGVTWIDYGCSSCNPSNMPGINHSFLALNVEKTSEPHLTATEDLEVLLYPLEDIKKILLSGGVMEGAMQASLWRYIFEVDRGLLNR